MPALAASWERIGERAWRFNLRQDLKFSDGSPLTAADVVFSFNRFLGRLPGRFAAAGKVSMDFIEKVEAMGDSQVVITTREPTADFVSRLRHSVIVPQAYYASNPEEVLDKQPVGAGPYKVVSRKIQESMTLEANEHYYNKTWDQDSLGPPVVKTIIYRVIPQEATQIAALRAGEVDAVQTISQEQAELLSKREDIKVYYNALDRPSFIMMNCITPIDQKTNIPNPLMDIRVRRALIHAVNVEELIASYLTGREKRTTLIGQNVFGHTDDVPWYEFNPQKAKELLTQAGYSKGLSLTYYAWDSVGPVTQALQKYWQDVGVSVQFKKTTRSLVWVSLMKRKERLIGLVPWAQGGSPDPDTWFSTFVPADGPFALHEPNEKLMELNRAQSQEFDAAKRARIIKEMVDIIWDQAWVLPLWEPVTIKALNTRWGHKGHPVTQSFVLTNLYPQ